MKIDQLKGGAALAYLNIFIMNIMGLVVTPFIIRSLGSSEYGLYTMIGALVGYLSIMDFGLTKTIVRFIAKYRALEDENKQQNFLAHAFIMYGFISLLILVVGSIFYFNLDTLFEDTLTKEQIYKAEIMMLILLFNMVVCLPGGAFSAICMGYEQFILPKITSIIKYVLRGVLVIMLLLKGGGAIALVVLDTLLNILLICAHAFIAIKILKVKVRLHLFNKELLRSVITFSFWIFIYGIVHQLRWQFGQLLIGLFYSTTVVAIYAVGITLGNYYGAFSGAIAGVFLPKATKMGTLNYSSDEITDMFIKISRILLFILLFLLGGFFLVGKEFIVFWVGSEYLEAYEYTLYIMIGLTPILSQGFANNILEAKNLIAFRGKVLLALTLAGTIFGVMALKFYGVKEFVLVTVLFILAERIVMNRYYIRKGNLNMSRYYLTVLPIYVTIVMLILIVFSASHFLQFLPTLSFVTFKVLVYSIGYLIAFQIISNEFEKNEFKKLLKLIKLKKE